MTAAWIAPAVCGVFAGAALVAACVAVRPFDVGAAAAAAIALSGGGWHAVSLGTGYSSGLATVLGLMFMAAGFVGGYRLASSVLLDTLAYRRHAAPPRVGRAERMVMLLSDAEPPRYSPSHTAERLALLERTGAVAFSAGVLPLVFLAERMRYRAVKGPHPARAVVDAIADGVRRRLCSEHPGISVMPVYADAPLDLEDIADDERPSVVTVIEVGAAGSLPYVEAHHALERATPAGITVRWVSPSIWRDCRLAERLCDRIMHRVPPDQRSHTGLVLLGIGIPDEWREASTAWSNDENFFITRVTMLLEEVGFARQSIRTAWLGWQSPSLSETVRHLAAIGCSRIVIAPATVIYPDLAMLLDAERDVRDARIPEHIVVTSLPTWGDDEVLTEVIASRIEEAMTGSDRSV